MEKRLGKFVLLLIRVSSKMFLIIKLYSCMRHCDRYIKRHNKNGFHFLSGAAYEIEERKTKPQTINSRPCARIDNLLGFIKNIVWRLIK
jgi:hypothetical protein